MAKAQSVDVVEDLKKLFAAGKLVLGVEETEKKLKLGKLERVFLSANCATDVRSDLEQFCRLNNVQCVALKESAEEIGTACKKPFSVSVVGVLA